MKKVFALALVLSCMSGLYGLTLGIGAAYEGLLVDGADPYLALKVDARVPLMKMIDIRACVLNVSLPEGGKNIYLGTFTDSDLLIKPDMGMPFKPYIALGVWFRMGLEDAPGDYQVLGLKGALGGEFEIGSIGAYIEAGLNKFQWIKDGGSSHPVYVQLGLTFPVNL
jgi:hypothetical protein